MQFQRNEISLLPQRKSMELNGRMVELHAVVWDTSQWCYKANRPLWQVPRCRTACKAIKCYRCFRTKCVQNVALYNNCLFFTWHKNLHMHTKKALRAMQASPDSKPAKAPVTRAAEAVLALPQCRGQRDDGGVKWRQFSQLLVSCFFKHFRRCVCYILTNMLGCHFSRDCILPANNWGLSLGAGRTCMIWNLLQRFPWSCLLCMIPPNLVQSDCIRVVLSGVHTGTGD